MKFKITAQTGKEQGMSENAKNEGRKGAGPMDQELKAISRCLRIMKDLPPGNRLNVCEYLMKRSAEDCRAVVTGEAPEGNSTGANKKTSLFT